MSRSQGLAVDFEHVSGAPHVVDVNSPCHGALNASVKWPRAQMSSAAPPILAAPSPEGWWARSTASSRHSAPGVHSLWRPRRRPGTPVVEAARVERCLVFEAISTLQRLSVTFGHQEMAFPSRTACLQVCSGHAEDHLWRPRATPGSAGTHGRLAACCRGETTRGSVLSAAPLCRRRMTTSPVS